MKVLVIGTGNMGAGFVKQLSAAGHQVLVAARDLTKGQALAQQPGAKAVAREGAAKDVAAVAVATPLEQAAAALRRVGDLAGKTVIDITNPLTPDYMGQTLGNSTSAAEEIARAVAESMGFQPQDAGGLRNARYLEPLAGLNIYFGYGAGLGSAIAPSWIRKS